MVRGFTLVELIAVMIILAILGVAVGPQLLDLRDDAKNANRITDAAAMAAELERLSLGNAIGHLDRGGGLPMNHCHDGASLARLLDPSQAVIKGALGVGGEVWYYSATAAYTQDPGWVYYTGPDNTPIPSGESRDCWIKRGLSGTQYPFKGFGCATGCSP